MPGDDFSVFGFDVLDCAVGGEEDIFYTSNVETIGRSESILNSVVFEIHFLLNFPQTSDL